MTLKKSSFNKEDFTSGIQDWSTIGLLWLLGVVLSNPPLVWLAADKANPHRTRPFHRYALLGDDIVIADKAVADEYLRL